MTRDLLERLGSELGEDLRTAAGPPPPLALLRRRRRRGVAARAVLTVLVVVVVFLALPNVLTGPGVSIDPVAPPTADPAAPTDPATTPVDRGGPVITPNALPDPVSLRLLAVRFNNPSLALLDLDTGEVRVRAPGQHGLPTQDAVGGAQLLADGSAVVWQHDTVTVLPPNLGAPTLVHRPETMVHGTFGAFRVVPTRDEQALWIAQIGTGYGQDAVDGRVEIVDISTGQVRMATDVPPGSFPIAVIDSGLVMTTTGGWVDTGDGWIDDPEARATLLVDDDGSITSISQGWAIAAGGSVVAIQSCTGPTGHTGCTGDLELLDLATGEQTVVEQPVDGRWTAVNTPAVPGDHAPWSAVAPDGRLLVGIAPSIAPSVAGQYATHVDLVVLDPATLTATTVSRIDGKGPWAARWDQHGNHIVIADGRDLILIDVETGTPFTLDNVVPEGHWVIAMR